jgi:hypothetical protein
MKPLRAQDEDGNGKRQKEETFSLLASRCTHSWQRFQKCAFVWKTESERKTISSGSAGDFCSCEGKTVYKNLCEHMLVFT